MKENIAIFWFRRDLRLEDNAALYHALQSGYKVLPIFIFDTIILDNLSNKSDARVSFILEQITILQQQLKTYNSYILTFHTTPIFAFQKLINDYAVKQVYTNTDYEPYAVKRDAEIANILSENSISFHSFKDQVIFEKSEIVKSDKLPYTIYTPYMKQWKMKLEAIHYQSFSMEGLYGNFYNATFSTISLNELGFSKSSIPIPSSQPNTEIIKKYELERNFPSLQTTKMGVHLRFGTVSIRQLVQKATQWSDTWLNELIWREFFMSILYHYPQSADKVFKSAYERVEWRNNETEFASWLKGTTGFPLVDAGMRELNATGFMHNRVRMVVASFLCKNLLIDWRWGEAYFAEKLLDYEQASNVGNWQWAAGTGCDAAPYFRVFSPTLQAEKFDKNMEYIRKWIPEYGTANYPQTIVDAKVTAKQAIEAYKKALQS